jgi:CRP-like cAMP-binding protein
VVFREGDICKNVYIVYKGEFEVIKRMKQEVKDEVNYA